MALSVIGAGFGRTGTLSIRSALEKLGHGPCYHMDNVFASPEHLARWQTVADGEPADWDRLFSGFKSTVDWPGALYWHELSLAYPNAKILLSVRPADPWWDSFSSTIKKLIEMRDSPRDEHLRSVLRYAHEIIAVQTFGGAMHDKSAVLAVYQQRIDEVTNSVPPERLLVFDVTEGWAPLCRFLDLPEPSDAFPRGNTKQEFWQHFGAGVAE